MSLCHYGLIWKAKSIHSDIMTFRVHSHLVLVHFILVKDPPINPSI